MTSTQTVKFQH